MSSPASSPIQPNELKRTLSPVMLWGLGVGYFISRMHFGWNPGLEQGGQYRTWRMHPHCTRIEKGLH
jgi:hypothetical protein